MANLSIPVLFAYRPSYQHDELSTCLSDPFRLEGYRVYTGFRVSGFRVALEDGCEVREGLHSA